MFGANSRHPISRGSRRGSLNREWMVQKQSKDVHNIGATDLWRGPNRISRNCEGRSIRREVTHLRSTAHVAVTER